MACDQVPACITANADPGPGVAGTGPGGLHADEEERKLVYVGRIAAAAGVGLEQCRRYGTGAATDCLRYNFETGIFSNDRGERFKNGKLVE